jgi:hypothetical protein
MKSFGVPPCSSAALARDPADTGERGSRRGALGRIPGAAQTVRHRR